MLSIIFIILFIACNDAFILSPNTLKGVHKNQLLIGKFGTTYDHFSSCNKLCMKSSEQESTNLQPEQYEGGLKAWISLDTRGGAIVWSIILTILPVGVYNYLVSTGLEDTKVGAYVGTSFVFLTLVLWASTYIFRVATKDMTYATQLRDYENAVLQKRLDELADDEITALMEEIEIEETKAKFDA